MNLSFQAYLDLLGTYLRPQRARVALLAALLLTSISLQLANPQVVKSFIDTTQVGGPQSALLLAALLFFAIGLVQRAITMAATWVGENVGWSATNALRADLTRHLLSLDMPFHKQRTPGELIERVDGDVSLLANFFSQLTIQVLGNGLLLAGIVVVLFGIDWRLGIAMTLYTLASFGVLAAIQRPAVSRWAASRQAEAEQFGFIEERLSGTEDIRANGGEGYILHQLYGLMRAALQKERSARLVSILAVFSTKFLYVLGYTLGLALGAYLVVHGQATIGAAFQIVLYIGMVAAPMENIRREAQDFQQATAGINRVQELFRLQPKVRENVRATLPGGALAVAFDRVRFEYDDRLVTAERRLAPIDDGEWTEHAAPMRVLHDVSFQLERGQALGLLGRTGSGKTSLTRLLFRLYDPTGGVIRLGGVDIRDVAVGDLRGRVGIVTQDVQLFQASVRDNLTFYDQNIADHQIEQALRDLGLWSWVQALPQGLDTPLASGGQGLSAGEAQLLAFARVFLRDPGLVILDEASSRLDPATERLLERAIDRLLANRTAIIIAHRLKTVLRADQILILEQGQVAEYGPREVLQRDPASRFSRLLRTGLEEVIR